tara:strand:+ start:474 stop:701 length:228 start_codon:yes stop_codon:yes gene_type:complete
LLSFSIQAFFRGPFASGDSRIGDSEWLSFYDFLFGDVGRTFSDGVIIFFLISEAIVINPSYTQISFLAELSMKGI